MAVQPDDVQPTSKRRRSPTARKPRYGMGSPTSKKRLESLARDARAFDLALAGLTLDEINTAMAVDGRKPWKDKSGVWHAVKRGSERYKREEIDTNKDHELARLRRIDRAMWTEMLKGDKEAARVLERISRHRARLLGWNAPARLEVDVRLSQEQAALIVVAVRNILRALIPHPTPEQKVLMAEVVPRELRAVSES